MNKLVSHSDCPIECDSLYFKTSINSAAYPTHYYTDMLLSQKKITDKFDHSHVFEPEGSSASSETPSNSTVK